jgi:hypothetical protein
MLSGIGFACQILDASAAENAKTPNRICASRTEATGTIRFIAALRF